MNKNDLRRKSKKGRIFGKKSLMLLFVLMLSFVFSGFVPNNAKAKQIAFAEETVTATEMETFGDGNLTQVVTDDNAGNIVDTIASPKWIVYGAPLGWTTKQDDYSELNYFDLNAIYAYDNDGPLAINYPINDECWILHAKDSTGNTVRLEPVNGLDKPNNINANGATTVTLMELNEPAGSCKFYNDTLQLRHLTALLAISGNSTRIGTGKILYRQTNGANWGAWSQMDLNASATMRFTQTSVQIAVIYELVEEGRVFWDRDIFHRIVGVYRFNIA